MRLFINMIKILLLPLFLQCTFGIIPQAIQDGPLRIFKSYSDVTIFHFSVPPEVIKATWQFAALMDGKNCIPRNAFIHLQWGSYPVISNSNSTPPNVFLTRDNSFVMTAKTTYKAEATVIFPVNSPQPGDWFVAAYLDYFDNKVQQDGIGHKCQYSIGSVAIWTQENSIKNIPIGYKNTMRTNQPSTYYKFLIPSGTSNFQVTIWNCKFTFTYSNRHSEVCIKAMAIKDQKLPVINLQMHSNSYINLTTNSTYTFDVKEPVEDSYYYLLILSDSVIDFNIEIKIIECPSYTSHTSIFLNQWILNINNSLRIKQSNDIQHFLTNFTNKNIKTDSICPKRLKLVRVKKLQTFSSVYLFHSRNGLNPWIMLTDAFPLIVQFYVIPIVDIGGSLDIGVILEIDKSILKQQVAVKICVRRGKMPGQNCTGNNDLIMNLSSSDKEKGNFIIPYPQPDTWYISFETKCYSNGILENCTMIGILASLNIQTQECIFSGENSCSHRGSCQELHRGLFHYTTCNCFKGYKGWGCSDESQLKSSFVISSLVLIISNIFFLPAIYLASKRKLYAQALIYFSTMFFSSFYHACDQKFIGYCISKYEVLQFSDFFSSILSFWMTLITMAKLPSKIENLLHIFGVIIVSFSVELNRTSLSCILIPSIIGIIFPISSHIYHCFKMKIWKWPNRIFQLIIGILLASFGFIIYSLIETEANYEYVHSIWHIIIAISLVFLLPSESIKRKNLSSKKLAIDSFNNIDNELLQLKERSDSPIFTIVN